MAKAVGVAATVAASMIKRERLQTTPPLGSTITPAGAQTTSDLGLDVSVHMARRRLPAGGLPVPALVMPDRRGAAYYTVTTVDARGRLADASPLRVLGWAPGRSIATTVMSGVLFAAAQPDGMLTVTGQGHLRLPADLRHSLRLGVGARLLVAAHENHGLLVAYTMPAVDAMVSSYHAATDGTVA